MDHDGLNNVTYKVRNVALEPLYTIITVDLPGPTTKAEMKAFFKARYEKLERMYDPVKITGRSMHFKRDEKGGGLEGLASGNNSSHLSNLNPKLEKKVKEGSVTLEV